MNLQPRPSSRKQFSTLMIFSLAAVCARAQVSTNTVQSGEIAPDVATKIQAIAQQTLGSTGVPSASISIVKDGKVAYSNAVGFGRLPSTSATAQMRYSIGSISKQFTAGAILFLEQDGKLKLDDPVSKYIPGLTRGDEITIRMILSHTSGYQDFWPQDYVMPPMLKPATPQYIMDTWAKKPLDFDPGTKWQYSNTNYVIAGQIVERVSGATLLQFLQSHIFTPLRMTSVYDSDDTQPGVMDPIGYMRYALGPPRPAPRIGDGWMFAAGELAMTASDLSLWNISMMNRSLLSADSYKEMFTPVKLKDGTDSHYGLGVFIGVRDGHAMLEHSGEVSGFVSENVVYPDDHAAIAVLTNEDASQAASQIARQIAPLILNAPASNSSGQADLPLAQAKAIFTGLQDGKLDRALFTANCNAYFSDQAIGDFASSLKPLGTPTSFEKANEELRGGMAFQIFRVGFSDPTRKLVVSSYTMPDGKLEQYLVLPAQ